jgi:hypothetical protein
LQTKLVVEMIDSDGFEIFRNDRVRKVSELMDNWVDETSAGIEKQTNLEREHRVVLRYV